MKRLFILILLGLAAWYGWKNYPQLFEKRDGHEAVIENQSGKTMTRVRVMIDGQTLVKEILPDGQTAKLPFKVANDAGFKMEWEYETVLGQRSWAGGMVPKGPMLQRHILLVQADDEVMYRAENK
ncbi:MAG: hypothetical protein ABIS67_02075 [Candidatus Eisenbacteria bacterium]